MEDLQVVEQILAVDLIKLLELVKERWTWRWNRTRPRCGTRVRTARK
jgi:hypothetical protein